MGVQCPTARRSQRQFLGGAVRRQSDKRLELDDCRRHHQHFRLAPPQDLRAAAAQARSRPEGNGRLLAPGKEGASPRKERCLGRRASSLGRRASSPGKEGFQPSTRAGCPRSQGGQDALAPSSSPCSRRRPASATAFPCSGLPCPTSPVRPGSSGCVAGSPSRCA